MDTDRCKPSDSIQAFLGEVGNAPRLVLVLSKPYFESEYTLKEFAIVLDHGGLNTRVCVVLAGTGQRQWGNAFSVGTENRRSIDHLYQ